MGSDVRKIFLTASLHRDHSILYALVCEKELSHMSKTTEILIWCARKYEYIMNVIDGYKNQSPGTLFLQLETFPC